MPHLKRRRVATVVAAVLVLFVSSCSGKLGSTNTAATATPIHHLVVIFQENVSFDHYFGTYPHAANTDGQRFTAGPDTRAVDG